MTIFLDFSFVNVNIWSSFFFIPIQEPWFIAVDKLKLIILWFYFFSVSQHAAKKTKKQVFVSYNLPVTDSSLTMLVENRIKKEMELHPDKF